MLLQLLTIRPGHTVVKNSLQARHDAVEFMPRHDTGCHININKKIIATKILKKLIIIVTGFFYIFVAIIFLFSRQHIYTTQPCGYLCRAVL